MRKIQLKAYAKINLGLDVLRKREDNYHEVRMIMQTIHLYDKIYLKEIRSNTIIIKTNLSYLPTNENNLVYKAIKMIKDEFHISSGIFVRLDKYIPVAAGMAGGSTDCAAALKGMNRLFNLGLSIEELMERGVRLGADVPYCILGGTALSEGIGEILTPLPPMPKCIILVVKPSMYVSTKFVYENLNLAALDSHPDIDGMAEAIHQNDIKNITCRLGNVLESVTMKEYPLLAELKKIITDAGALGSLMSGSGPTIFGIFNHPLLAQKAGKLCKAHDISCQSFVVSPYSPM